MTCILPVMALVFRVDPTPTQLDFTLMVFQVILSLAYDFAEDWKM